MNGERERKLGGERTEDNLQWAVSSGRRTSDGEQWAVNSGRQAVNGTEPWAMKATEKLKVW